MPYLTYKLIHVLGILMAFTALGGWCVHAANGGQRAGNVARTIIVFLHGAGVFLVLLGGFGMLARLEGIGWPGWLVTKLVIWAILGAALFVPYRRPGAAKPMLLILPLLGFFAAWLALYKPY